MKTCLAKITLISKGIQTTSFAEIDVMNESASLSNAIMDKILSFPNKLLRVRVSYRGREIEKSFR